MFTVTYDRKNSNSGQTIMTIISYNGKNYLTNRANITSAIGKYFLASLCSKTFKEMITYGLFLPKPEYEHPL